MRISLKTTSGKILASAALLGGAAAVAGLGTYGSFTSTTEAATAVTAGVTKIDVNGNGGWNNMNVPAAGLLPGDRVERLIALTNAGDQDLAAMALTATEKATTPSPLTTDKANGLQLTVEDCPVAWGGTVGAYTCSAPVTVLPARPVLGTNNLPALASLKAKGVDNLKVTLTLPVTADNTFQGAASTLGFSFTASQRATPVTK